MSLTLGGGGGRRRTEHHGGAGPRTVARQCEATVRERLRRAVYGVWIGNGVASTMAEAPAAFVAQTRK